MHEELNKLAEGGRRSIGKSNVVVVDVIGDPFPVWDHVRRHA